MPRLRLGVVLLVPDPIAHEVDGLRRGLGDPALDRVAPHLTLVPPLNVPVDRLGDALGVLRRAAGRARPLDLVLGPARRFDSDEGVVYLAVAGGGSGSSSGDGSVDGDGGSARSSPASTPCAAGCSWIRSGVPSTTTSSPTSPSPRGRATTWSMPR